MTSAIKTLMEESIWKKETDSDSCVPRKKYTEEEMVHSYINAIDRVKQVSALAELNLMQKKEVIEILKKHNVYVEPSVNRWYKKDELDWIKNNAKELTRKEIADKFVEKFGWEPSIKRITNTLRRYKLEALDYKPERG